MIIKHEEYAEAVIYNAQQFNNVEELEAHCIFSIRSDPIYIKRFNIQKLLGSEKNIEIMTKNTQSWIETVIKEFQFCQLKVSPYILEFSEIYYSFPYFGYIHRPIQDVFSSYLFKRIDYKSKINLMIAIMSAIENLHSRQICMRSLKPSTIVVTEENEDYCTVAFSEMRNYARLNPSRVVETTCRQTNEYSAPEIKKKDFHNLNCDVWSLGLMFYELLFEKSFKDSLDKQERITFPQNSPLWINRFLTKMLQQDPSQRYESKDVLVILKKAIICEDETAKYFASI